MGNALHWFPALMNCGTAKSRIVVCVVLVLATNPLSFTSAAGNSNASAADLLANAAQLTRVWAKPVKLTAQVRLLHVQSGTAELRYELFWTNPGAWRTQWLGGYDSVHVNADGKAWHKSNVDVPPLRVLQFERALLRIGDWREDGPFGSGIKGLDPNLYAIRNRKLDGNEAQCLEEKRSRYVSECFDSNSGLPMQFKDDLGRYEYGDYQKVGEAYFPKTVRILEDGVLVLEAQLQATSSPPSDPSLFAPLLGAEQSVLPTCLKASETAVGGRLVHQKRPVYPLAARSKSETGTVLFYVVIGKDGAIKRLDLLKSAGPTLDEAARDAVREWRYSPYVKCGQPVEVQTIITVNFNLFR